LDRSAFKKQSLKEADDNLAYWQNKTYEERLAAAFYLNSVAYNFDINNPPRMDKSVFSMRKHEK
ncbi:MAG: hypothetical protein NTU43_13360, partial [Bacteroidetes bacterium]|nr:hypothetical protein [Bacteroidota bacterium]